MNERREPAPAASQAWVLRARRLLDESAQQLDAATLSRLNRARQAALEQRAPRRRVDLLRTLGLGAVTAGLALVLWRGGSLPELPAEPAGGTVLPALTATPPVDRGAVPVAAPDFDLLVDPESYAVIEDLEFYAWLQAEEGQGG
jgi:hypothetical protein